MTIKYNTGNPVGSADPRDLYDTATVADNLVNGSDATYPDRLGVDRRSWKSVEDQAAQQQADFDDFLASSGYQFMGDYAAGIELTTYNQIVRDGSGEFWRVSGSTTLPYTTTGAGLPEGGAFVAVGEAVLRQELNSNTAGNGSDLIAHTGTDDTVTETLDRHTAAIDKRTIFVGSVADIEALSTSNGCQALLGGIRLGKFEFDSSDLSASVSSDPLQGIYIAPSSDPTGASGAWVRATSGLHPRIEWWGGTNINDALPLAAMASYIKSIEDTTYRYSGNFIVGDEPMTLNVARRDVFQVARRLTGGTDCHAFSDKTVIDTPSDAGTYGTFDSTTRVEGAHSQNHQFSFQDRAIYAGTGDIWNWAGFICWPQSPGSGTVTNRYGMWLKDVDQQGGGGLIKNNSGIYIENLQNGTANAAIHLQQNSGFGIYAPNLGRNRFGGQTEFLSEVGFGTMDPISGLPATFTRGNTGDQKAFVSTNSVSAQWGVSGDFKISFVADSAERLVLEDSSNNYALRPASVTQDLGTPAISWNVARLKQVKFDGITSASAENNSLFVDSADGLLKFKNSSGTVQAITS